MIAAVASLDQRTRLRALLRPLDLMAHELLVDVLLLLGVAGEQLACIGCSRCGPLDRLHYAAAGNAVPAFLILAALLVRVGFTSRASRRSQRSRFSSSRTPRS